VTLHAERPVVQKETVPVERVRLETDQVAEEARVDETVRKEQIEADGTGNAYPDDPMGTKMSGKERAKGR
jgi:stress response protein YsnF